MTREGAAFGDVDQELEAAHRTVDMARADRVRHTLFQLPNLGEEPGGLAWFAYRAAVAHIYAADALTTAPRDGVRNVLLTVEDILDNTESSLDRLDLLPLLYALVVGQPRTDDRLSALIPEVVQALGALPRSAPIRAVLLRHGSARRRRSNA